MEYLIVFIEGIISFISPCLLPMLPMYLSYFAGQSETATKKETILSSMFFVLGFTVTFTLLGTFAGILGSFINQHMNYINILLGSIVILIGFNYLGIFHIKWFNQSKELKQSKSKIKYMRTFLFGMIFSIAWTPCVGAFLGSALMMTAAYGEVLKGAIMLLLFSIGLGIPFIISSIFLDKLKNTFDWIKKHYNIINTISGILLIIIGVCIVFGVNMMFVI